MSRVSKTAVWAVAVGFCSVVIAAPADATKSEPVIGGHTTITASPDITKLVDFLRAQGITVTVIGPATLANGSLTMPMVSGSMSVPSMHGVMDAEGGCSSRKGTGCCTSGSTYSRIRAATLRCRRSCPGGACPSDGS